MPTSSPALAIVVVAHNSAAHLPALIDATLRQLEEGDELVVVDNASEDVGRTTALVAAAGPRVRLIRSPRNDGFAAGCHLGARATAAPLLLFLNPDCVPEPGCLGQLRAASQTHPRWGAWQAAVLLPDGRINTDGGVIHYTGVGWAGDCGLPQSALPHAPREVGFPSGAALVIRRGVWEELGGLDPAYFLYSEDLDLGLRVWLAGHRCGIVPGARVTHGYEFHKGEAKFFWLERNRWWTLLSTYPAILLLLLAPMLLAAELAIHTAAWRGGWLSTKLRADAAVLATLTETLARRRRVQSQRRITTRQFTRILRSSMDSEFLPLADGHPAARAQAAYWAILTKII